MSTGITSKAIQVASQHNNKTYIHAHTHTRMCAFHTRTQGAFPRKERPKRDCSPKNNFFEEGSSKYIKYV